MNIHAKYEYVPGYFPRLIILLPHVAAMSIIIATHPELTSFVFVPKAVIIPPIDEEKLSVDITPSPPVIKPVSSMESATLSNSKKSHSTDGAKGGHIDYQANLQGIQNLMGMTYACP